MVEQVDHGLAGVDSGVDRVGHVGVGREGALVIAGEVELLADLRCAQNLGAAGREGPPGNGRRRGAGRGGGEGRDPGDGARAREGGGKLHGRVFF